MAEATSPAKRLTGAHRRELFLEAAAEIVVEGGPSFLTMERVAGRTGVTKRLAYRYFENREQLLQVLLDRELQEIGRKARDLLPQAPDLRQTVETHVRIWLQTMQERGPLLSKLLFDQDVAATVVREVNRRAVANWAQAYEDLAGMAPAAAEAAACILLSALRGATEALARQAMAPDDIAAVYTALAVAGAKEIATRYPGR